MVKASFRLLEGGNFSFVFIRRFFFCVVVNIIGEWSSPWTLLVGVDTICGANTEPIHSPETTWTKEEAVVVQHVDCWQFQTRFGHDSSWWAVGQQTAWQIWWTTRGDSVKLLWISSNADGWNDRTTDDPPGFCNKTKFAIHCELSQWNSKDVVVCCDGWWSPKKAREKEAEDCWTLIFCWLNNNSANLLFYFILSCELLCKL